MQQLAHPAQPAGAQRRLPGQPERIVRPTRGSLAPGRMPRVSQVACRFVASNADGNPYIPEEERSLRLALDGTEAAPADQQQLGAGKTLPPAVAERLTGVVQQGSSKAASDLAQLEVIAMPCLSAAWHATCDASLATSHHIQLP